MSAIGAFSIYFCDSHPSFLQLYATASSSGIHAAIFHDEFTPAKRVLEGFRGSHFPTVHLWRSIHAEFNDAERYIGSVSDRFLHPSECMLWIRSSTGRLCIDLTPSEYLELGLSDHMFHNLQSLPTASLFQQPEDYEIIDSMPLDLYHTFCFIYLREYRWLRISEDTLIQLGAVLLCPVDCQTIENSVEIACNMEHAMYRDGSWLGFGLESTLIMENGWTRVNSSEIGDGDFTIDKEVACDAATTEGWLAQANHIFNRLDITFNHKDYVLVDYIICHLALSSRGKIPPGYLFLCPLLQPEFPGQVRYPECPAYWSSDPYGSERIPREEAEQRGFPGIQFSIDMAMGHCFDERVYTGIRQFHKAKGYDPDRQDLARELGYPLFQAWAGLHCSRAHIQETNETGEDEELLGGISVPTSALNRGHCVTLQNMETTRPSKVWRLVMGTQFTLIAALILVGLYETFQTSLVVFSLNYFPHPALWIVG
ncbi:hypothetical protein MVEN_00709800 [Mycena venus]|uniref:Uncharacterized protein n=1 Tax=Mycena venus TaxID=2733690 RepID=A0A8H7D2N0_9AGAR|nr:hypothetical protein MVEN_00709800 [Mycena venus]